MPVPPLISIVIVTRDRPATMLRLTLAALTRQTAPALEMLVIDTSPGDELPKMINSEFPHVRVLHFPDGPRCIPWSRNMAINSTAGEVIAFIDDDAIAEPQWLEALIRSYRSDDVGGVGGRIIEGIDISRHLPEQVSPAVFDRNGIPQADYNSRTNGIVEVEHLKGCNMSFRRDALRAVGGFDERFVNNVGREDTDVCVRIRHAGYRLYYNPEATVEHKGYSLFAHKRIQIESIVSGYPWACADGYYVAKNFGVPAWTRWYLKSNIRAFARALKVTYMAFARATLSLGGGVVGLAQASRRHSTGVTAPSLQGVTESDTPLPSLSGRGE